MMRKLLAHHGVAHSFLPVLFAFGEQPRASEEGSGSLTVHRSSKAIYRISEPWICQSRIWLMLGRLFLPFQVRGEERQA